MEHQERPPVGTHAVENQPPPLVDYNVFLSDRALVDAVTRSGAAWARARLAEFGAQLGRAEWQEHGRLANVYKPELRTHDRYGNRVDEVDFHPSWHALMATGVANEVHALPWNMPDTPGSHVARVAGHFLLTQIECGVLCPLTMTFAAVPALRAQPELDAEWSPRLRSPIYDPGLRNPAEKRGCLMGMAMTEKQGGSDVRVNTTRAEPEGGAAGPGAAYRLWGHKWFCSAPMCDAFLTLAHAPGGLSCFLVPRVLPDGARNEFRIQRLKDKLGNRSNASSEIEYWGTHARMVGEEGRGIPTIIEMVTHTRLDCVSGSAGIMRQAVAQAAHHARHRAAFGKRLIDQPLMESVLADLALESEAATALTVWLARLYDEARVDPERRPLARIATAITKFWVCKRCPGHVYEALECLGGAGYVEESIMPRLYREAPLSSIWEGSGNVICLDVLRAMSREPECVPALLGELQAARGVDRRYDALLVQIERALADREGALARARRIVSLLALALQGSVLLREAPDFVAAAYCLGRIEEPLAHVYGTLPAAAARAALVTRAAPDLDAA